MGVMSLFLPAGTRIHAHFFGVTVQQGCRMTPENPGKQKRDGTNRPVDLPDRRSLGARHSVILVADDDALIRNLVTLLMQQDGHFVLSAADGHEGLEL